MTPKNFQWPTPPFYAVNEDHPVDVQGHDCVVELFDGRTVPGELAQFEPGDGLIALKVYDSAELAQFPIDKVRMLKLLRSLKLRPDVAVIEGIGGDQAQVTGEKDFHVWFADDSEFSGKTHGFVEEAFGLFLFPVDAGAGTTATCFIPASALRDVRIGPLLGEVLTANNVIRPGELVAALDKQAALRAEPLGEYLRQRAIVSSSELARALEAQKRYPNVRLGEMLLEAHIISQGQLDQALTTQKANRNRQLGEILVNMGALTSHQIQEALAMKLGIPFIDAREFKLDIETLKLAQEAYAKQNQVLPLIRTEHALVVAVENPLASNRTHELRFATGLSIIPVMAAAGDLQARIAKEYGQLRDRSTGFSWEPAVCGSTEQSWSPEERSRDDLEKMAIGDLAIMLTQEAPRPAEPGQAEESAARVSASALVRLVNKMIMDAHGQGASDIHIEANSGTQNLLIRFRKDGALADYLELEPAYRNVLVSRIKIMADLDISERRRAQDGKIDFSRFGGIPIELRVAVIPTANNLEDVVLRILAGAERLPLDKLGFSAHNMNEMKKMASRSYGLILVCGPTGSGKTTTLHSVLPLINRRDTKIWTAEDPIEISQPGLRQVQVNPKIGWTFAAAMRAFLRADPDVIMVGEMRDAETAKIGIEASLTGHLVLSTLHTNNAAESIVRLLDLGMDPFNFADALIGILSQRLARTLCMKCKQPYAAADKEIAELAQEYCTGTALDPEATARAWHATFGTGGQIRLYAANTSGCQACNAGYKGRVGVYELLVATPRIKELIHAHATAVQIAVAAIAEGMTLLRQDGIDKVLQGALDMASARSAYS